MTNRERSRPPEPRHENRGQGSNVTPHGEAPTDAGPMESLRETIAKRLRFAREISGLTQGQVAKLMRLHRPTVSEIEAGRRRVSADELTQFAQHYHTSVAWLTGEQPDIADPSDDQINLAARELSKLSKDDLDRVLRVLAVIRAHGETTV